jgi:hypothetical protein
MTILSMGKYAKGAVFCKMHDIVYILHSIAPFAAVHLVVDG